MRSKVIYLMLTAAVMSALSGCVGEVNGIPEPRTSPPGTIEAGRRLIANYGCGSCHMIPGVPGANSMAAAPLKCFYQRAYIAGRLPNTKGNLVLWIQNPQQIDPGNAMPDLGVSEDEASDIADYLYDPPAFWGLVPSHVLDRKCSQ